MEINKSKIMQNSTISVILHLFIFMFVLSLCIIPPPPRTRTCTDSCYGRQRNAAHCALRTVCYYLVWPGVSDCRKRFDKKSTLTSPYASGRYRGQYRKCGGHDLRRRRYGLRAVVTAAFALFRDRADLRRPDELVLGRDPRTVLLQELHDYTVGPAEAQLHLVLAPTAVSSGHGGVVLLTKSACK